MGRGDVSVRKGTSGINQKLLNLEKDEKKTHKKEEILI